MKKGTFARILGGDVGGVVGEFKALAGIGTKSCAVSVLFTLALLLAFGPRQYRWAASWPASWSSCLRCAAWCGTGWHAMAERVVIAIPTYRRPLGLKRLLDAIACLKTRCDVTVLVADNDAGTQKGLPEAKRYGRLLIAGR